MVSKAVIASHLDVGVFADVEVSEAIQSFLLQGRLDCFVAVALEDEGFAPRNDELNRLILLNAFPASL